MIRMRKGEETILVEAVSVAWFERIGFEVVRDVVSDEETASFTEPKMPVKTGKAKK